MWTCSGGSPYNAAARFAAQREDADVVTGVNLPMLIEVLGRRMLGGTLPELVEMMPVIATPAAVVSAAAKSTICRIRSTRIPDVCAIASPTTRRLSRIVPP